MKGTWMWALIYADLYRLISAGLFHAFPVVDSAQHAVFEAEVVQLVGTVDAHALEIALRAVGDTLWQPLLVAGDDQQGRSRAIFSIGIGDFRNTSEGPYRELALAFPSCESPVPIMLNCRNFVACQTELPDCAHTYMFRSFVSLEDALWRMREAGVDARLASVFDLRADVETGRKLVHATVLGPGGQEVLDATIEAPLTSIDNTLMGAQASNVMTEGTSKANPSLSSEGIIPDTHDKTGYNIHPYVGAPAVLGVAPDSGSEPIQARHLCAFPSNVDVRPARLAGPLHVGSLLEDLVFGLEGVMHLPDFSLMRFPPWANRKSSGKRRKVQDAQYVYKKGGDDGVFGSLDSRQAFAHSLPDQGTQPSSRSASENLAKASTESSGRSEVPWKQARREGGDPVNFPWDLHDTQASSLAAAKQTDHLSEHGVIASMAVRPDGSATRAFPW